MALDPKDPKVQEQIAERTKTAGEALTKAQITLAASQDKHLRLIEKETRVKEKQVKAAQKIVETEVSIQEAKEDLELTRTKEWRENLKLQREAKKLQDKAREARKDYRQELTDSIMEPFRAVKDAIPKPVQILTAWGMRGAKGLWHKAFGNIFSSMKTQVVSGIASAAVAGKVAGKMSGSKKSEPIKEVYIEKAHIKQPIGFQVQGKAPSSKFKEEEEKREEARTDSEAGKVEKLAPAGGSGMLSKASGFLKGIFGGSRFAGIARVFAPIMAVAGTIMSWLFMPLMITLVGAGLLWLSKNSEWVKKNIMNRPEVQTAIKVVKVAIGEILVPLFVGLFGVIKDSIVEAARQALGLPTQDERRAMDEVVPKKGSNPRDKAVFGPWLTGDYRKPINLSDASVGDPWLLASRLPGGETEEGRKHNFNIIMKRRMETYLKQTNRKSQRSTGGLSVNLGEDISIDIKDKEQAKSVISMVGDDLAAHALTYDKTKVAIKELSESKMEGRYTGSDRDYEAERQKLLTSQGKAHDRHDRISTLLNYFKRVFKPGDLSDSPPHLGKQGAVGKPLNDWLPKLGSISTVLTGILNVVSLGLLGVPDAGAAGLDTHNMNVAHSKFTKQRTPAQEALMEILRQGETGAHGGYDALNISKKGHFSRTLWETNQGRIVRDPSQLRDGEMWTTMQPRNTALAPGEDGSWQAAGGKRITEMTLEEIMTAQAARKMMHVGAYQIAPKTMTGIMDNIAREQGGGAQGAQYVEQLKKMKFGKSMQDRFARRLMNSAIRKYRLGLWDKKQTIDELGNIWGAIPAVGGGSLLPGHQSPSLDRSEIGDFLDRIVGRSQETVRGYGLGISKMSMEERLALGFGRDLVQGQQQLSFAGRPISGAQGSTQIVMAPRTDASVTNINLTPKSTINVNGPKSPNTTIVQTI